MDAQMFTAVIPSGTKNPLQWSQVQVKAISEETGLDLKDFIFIAEFESERGRVMFKPLGFTGIGSHG